MSTHPSEDFVARYLEARDWTVRQNMRVKVHRNWSDLDVLATPLGGASRPVWIPAAEALVHQVVQVKWRGVFAWDLATAKPDDFLEYVWPKKRRQVLARAADLCGGDFDWVFLSTRLWVPQDAAARRRLETHLLAALKPDVPRLRAVRLFPLEGVCDDWLSLHAERSGGWADDPFTFLADLLVRSERLKVSDAIAAAFTSGDRLGALAPELKVWSTACVDDRSDAGPLAGLHRWLRAICEWCGFPAAAVGGYDYKAPGSQGVYAELSKEDGYWIGFWRRPDGGIELQAYWKDRLKKGWSLEHTEESLAAAEKGLLTWMRSAR